MNNSGFILLKNFLSIETQKELLNEINNIIKLAPLYIPTLWNGYPFKVANTNAGLYGWVSNKNGYSYVKNHPETNDLWPEIPQLILNITKELIDKSGYFNFNPESCLINFYNKNSKLGLHRDDTEQNLSAPIISISLGDTAHFYLGGLTKKDKLTKILIESGDCYVQGNQSRLFYHQIKKIDHMSSNLIEGGGRFNLTIRQIK